MTLPIEKPAFTPGPWSVKDTNERDMIDVRAGSEPIARMAWMPETGIQRSRANARLIAAAPELLEALENLRRWTHTDETDAQALAAIAKARGEP